MGKNRKRGSKNSQRGKEVPSFVEFLEQCFDEARAQHQRELGYIEDVIIQKYCERMREVLPNSSTEDIQAVATAPSSECFIALKRDLGGARGISDARLQEILLEKFQRLENGNTFVRKLLFVYWLLKIEYDDKLRDSLKKVCLEDISDNERKVKLQEISDAFYSDNDFEKPTGEELLWYCSHYKLDETEETRLIFKEFQNMENQNTISLSSTFGAPDEFVLKILEKAVNYGVQCHMKELEQKHAESSSLELKKAEKHIEDIMSEIEILKKNASQREKVIDDLQRQLLERDESVQSLQKQVRKLTKKTLNDYVPPDGDKLILKCLELSCQADSLDALASKILRDANYDDQTVEAKAGELSETILHHLNSIWDEKYLLKYTKKKFVGTKERAVASLLKFNTLN